MYGGTFSVSNLSVSPYLFMFVVCSFSIFLLVSSFEFGSISKEELPNPTVILWGSPKDQFFLALEHIKWCIQAPSRIVCWACPPLWVFWHAFLDFRWVFFGFSAFAWFTSVLEKKFVSFLTKHSHASWKKKCFLSVYGVHTPNYAPARCSFRAGKDMAEGRSIPRCTSHGK